MLYVIGSGPAGVACAEALVSGGHEVTLLDAGLTLEPEREVVARAAGCRSRDTWTREEIRILRTLIPPDGGIPLKQIHGSDYPYRMATGGPTIDYGTVGIRASYAQGGLSNVWGAAVLPFSEHDLRDWPVDYEDMARSYAAVQHLLPIAGFDDALAKLFPSSMQAAMPVVTSRQVRRLIDRCERGAAQLIEKGIRVGRARLAVNTGAHTGKECNYCGYCLHGCPRDAIYSSRHTLQRLLATGRVRYLPGVVVRQVVETETGVMIDARDSDGAILSLRGDRVFLGAGAINSTVILLRSLGRYDSPVRFKDSQYFLFPMVQARAAPSVASEQLHTLSQAFIEINDRDISPYGLHMQVYGYSDHLDQLLDHRLGVLKHVFPKNAILGRLLLVQAYLHSIHSGALDGVLKRTEGGDLFRFDPWINPETATIVGRALSKLRGSASILGAVPLGFMTEITEPGRGFHIGGSFPMAANPGPEQTDTLGRPYRMSRVHVIDSTVFPSIPATTITLSIMANAYRIGEAASRLQSYGN